MFSCIVGLNIGILLLSHTDKLATSLQNPALTARDARSMALNVISTMRSFRSDSAYDEFMSKVNELQISLGKSLFSQIIINMNKHVLLYKFFT